MTATHDLPEDFAELLGRFADGVATDDETAQLANLLRTNDTALSFYLDYADLESRLIFKLIPPPDVAEVRGQESGVRRQESVRQRETPAEPEQKTADAQPSAFSLQPSLRAKSLLDRASRHPLGPSVAVATIGVVAIVLLAALTPVGNFFASGDDGKHEEPKPREAQEIATLTGWHRIDWKEGYRLSARDHRLRAGQKVAMLSGLAEITYDTGAKVVLEGPCEFVVGGKDEGGRLKAEEEKTVSANLQPSAFSLQPSNSGYLEVGRLVARCDTQDSKGFTVATPGGAIEDVGTEFGVTVRDDDVEITVFEGNVVVTPAGHGLPTMELGASQSATIASDGRIARDDSVRHEYVRRIEKRKDAPTELDVTEEYVNTIVESKPIAYWRLSQASATHVPNQIADRNHARRHFGAAAPDDPTRMDGMSKYLEVENEIGDAFSLELWIRMVVPSHRGKWPFEGSTLVTCEIPGHRNDFTFAVLDDRVAFEEGPEETDTRSARTIVDGRWHHVVLVRERGSEKGVRLYVDGKLEAQAAANNQMLNENSKLFIGGSPPAKRYFNGWIDEVAIYDRALTGGEIKAHFELVARR